MRGVHDEPLVAFVWTWEETNWKFMGIYPAVAAPQGNFLWSQNHPEEFKVQKTFSQESIYPSHLL